MEIGTGSLPASREPWSNSESVDVPERTFSQSQMQREFMHARYRVQSLRAQIGRGRLGLIQSRSELRHLRQRTMALEESFLAGLETTLAQEADDRYGTLCRLLAQIREAHDEIRLGEDEFNRAEDRLAADEHALNYEEDSFYLRYDTDPMASGFDPSPTSSLPWSPEGLPQRETSPYPKSPNPLHEYETKVGQAKVLRETLDNMTMNRDEVLQDKARRESQGQELDAADLHFLNTFGNNFEVKVDELNDIERDISRLENEAISTELLHPSTAYSRTISPVPPLSTLSGPTMNDQTASQPGSISQPPSTAHTEPKLLREDQVKTVPPVSFQPSPQEHMRNARNLWSTASGMNVLTWLSQLDRFRPFERVLGMAENFTARDGSRMQMLKSFKGYIVPLGSSDRETSIKTKRRISTASKPREAEHVRQSTCQEPPASAVPRSISCNSSQSPSQNLVGLGVWQEQSTPTAPESPPRDWEILPETPIFDSSPNGSPNVTIENNIGLFFRKLSLFRPSKDPPLQRPKTNENPPTRRILSHSSDGDNEESRSV